MYMVWHMQFYLCPCCKDAFLGPSSRVYNADCCFLYPAGVMSQMQGGLGWPTFPLCLGLVVAANSDLG
jgi:hypothetical protein